MPTVSVPQLAALALLIIAVLLFRARGTAHRHFAAVAATGAVLAFCVSLRFDFGVAGARAVQATLAALLPPLTWTAFERLADPNGRLRWHHFAPVVLMPVLMWRAPVLIDPFIALLFLGYGSALLWLWRKGPDALAGVTLAGAVPASRALLIGAIALLGSAVVDILVALDFGLGSGAHAPTIIGIAQLSWLLVCGLVAFVAGRSVPDEDEAEPIRPAPLAPEDEKRIVAAVDDLLSGQAFYKDANLTLTRIARKIGIPARQVSVAINRAHGRNVSQHVNALRISEACRLLRESRKPVTEIMFDAGFQTKSNFNREFRRITGMSPSDWRSRQPQAAS